MTQSLFRPPFSTGTEVVARPGGGTRPATTITNGDLPYLPVTKTGRLSQKRLPRLTVDEARALTNEIKARTVQLWLLVERAHDGKAYAALGYNTWKEYAEKELQLSESRSFQLLDQAKVMRELAAAGVDVGNMDPVPARVVAKVKHALPQVREAAKEALQGNYDVHDAIRDLARSIDTPRALEQRSTGADLIQPSRRAYREGEVACPACAGRGHMSEAQADLLQQFIDSATATTRRARRA